MCFSLNIKIVAILDILKDGETNVKVSLVLNSSLRLQPSASISQIIPSIDI